VATQQQQYRRVGIQLSYGGFGSAVCFPALLIVNLVYRGIQLAGDEPGSSQLQFTATAVNLRSII